MSNTIEELERSLSAAQEVIRGYESDIGRLDEEVDTQTCRADDAESALESAQCELDDTHHQLEDAEKSALDAGNELNELKELTSEGNEAAEELVGAYDRTDELERMLRLTQSTLKAEERRNLNAEIVKFLGLE